MGLEVGIYASVLAAHELAHALTARAFDLQVVSLELLPFGGVAEIRGLELADPGVEAVVALAGPLHNLLLLAGGFVLRQAGWLAPARGSFFLAANAALALGNLLPGLPLDGGRVLRAALSVRSGVVAATALVARTGLVAGVALALASAVLLLRGTQAPGLVVFSGFLLARARPDRRAAPMRAWRELLARSHGPGDRVLAVQHLAAAPNTPLLQVLDALLPGRYHLLWRVETSGRLAGPWDEVQMLEALRGTGARATVGHLAAPRSSRPPSAEGMGHGGRHTWYNRPR